MATTTLEVPTAVRDRLREHKQHPRQAYHEVITRSLDALEAQRSEGRDKLLERHRKALRALAQRHGVQARIIGSRAEGRARSGDDLDLVVRLQRGRSLFDLAAFAAEAEATLPVPVHVRTAGAVPAREQKRILRQAVPL